LRRLQPLHPSALLIDQDRRIGLADGCTQFLNQLSNLAGRVDIALEKDEPHGR
jgi:hypothetical protein